MSLLQFLRILMARKGIVITAFLGALVTALLVSQLLPKRFEATSRVILDVLKPDPVTGESIGGRSIGPYVRTQVELIRDYRTAGIVVDRLGWANDPVFIAQYNGSVANQAIDIRRWLAQRIIEGTSARLVDGSNILEIAYEGTSPDAARQIADLIREAYISESLRFRRQSAQATADWYRNQAERARSLLTTAEQARSKYARDNGIVLNGDNSDVESSKLAALSGQSAAAAAAPTMPAAAVISPSALALDQLDQQIAQASMTLGPNHPGLQGLQRQRIALAAAAGREMAAGRVSVNTGQAERAFEAQKSRVLAQRDKIDELAQMQRDIELRREQYLKASQRAADLRLEADVGEVGLTPLGDAAVPESPSFPNVPLIVAGAAGVGLALGIAIALLVEMLGRRVRSDDDLEYAAGAPVFAVIGVQPESDGPVRRILKWFDRRKALGEDRFAEA